MDAMEIIIYRKDWIEFSFHKTLLQSFGNEKSNSSKSNESLGTSYSSAWLHGGDTS